MATSDVNTTVEIYRQGRELTDRVLCDFTSEVERISREHGLHVAQRWAKCGRGRTVLALFTKLNRQFPQAGGAA